MKLQKKILARRIEQLAAASVCVLVMAPAMAGKIVSNTATPPGAGGDDSGIAHGWGGWNLDNVEVFLNPGSTPIPFTGGFYDFPDDSDHTYYSDVLYGDMVVGRVLAKDWPIGEPAGIKVINGPTPDGTLKNGKPASCIMSTSYLEGAYLDTSSPDPVVCGSPYQTHKRFKVAMLPETLTAGPIDLVFNVEGEEGERNYEVFQKINNWTATRLTGFSVQVGFGLGGDFTPATDLTKLRITVPDTLWDPDQLATFSAGLFGPLDEHGQVGFFDEKTRAGFFIDEYGEDSGNTGTSQITATRRLGSNYDELPRGVEAMNQFGLWLPNNALPYGIFFDDDGNPDTDAALVAWYGYNPAINELGWMRGVADKFVAVEDTVIEGYANSLLYSYGVIDDLVNVGLNYIVTVGDVAAFPAATFTIRITPSAVESGTDEAVFPPYVTEIAAGVWTQFDPELVDETVNPDADPWLRYNAAAATVEFSPGPVFEIGDVLTARVGDAGANIDREAIESVVVQIDGSDLTLYELGEDRGVFAANLPSGSSDVPAGTVITMTYEGLAATTTAVEPQIPEVSYDLSVLEFEVPETVVEGKTDVIKVRIENDHKTLDSASGFVRLTGSVDGVDVYTFEDVPFTLDPGKKDLATFRWTAALTEGADENGESVDWSAGIYVDVGVAPILIDEASGSTLVEPKAVRKNAKNQ